MFVRISKIDVWSRYLLNRPIAIMVTITDGVNLEENVKLNIMVSNEEENS